MRLPLIRRPEADSDLIVENDGSTRWETRQKIRDILERNKRLRNEERAPVTNTQNHRRHVADIPVTVFEELKRTLGDPGTGDPDVSKRWKAWLNDPDNRAFRTDPRRL